MGEATAQAPVDIRTAEPGDLDALMSLSLAAARSDLGWAGDDWMPPDPVTARQLWWDRLRDPNAWVGVAVAGFTRVGCAATWPARNRGLAYLAGPLVDPEWWGEGIGGALLDASLTILTQLDFARAEIAIPAGNQRGRRFLERRGWTEAGQPGPRNPMALIVYTRALKLDEAERRAA